MAGEQQPWVRQGEAFWRAHHEAWKRSDLNQREYCEAQGIPRKAFENWRAQFKAEPQPPEGARVTSRAHPTLQKKKPQRASPRSPGLAYEGSLWGNTLRPSTSHETT